MIDPIDKYMHECRNTPEHEKSILRDLWHYPSKGEFPPRGEEVLIRIDNKNYLGTYDGKVMWDIPLAEITCSGDWVDMWQYIIPPKEEA